MEFKNTDFDDLLIGETQKYMDERGYFYESFRLNSLENEIKFVQSNVSKSTYGVLRGLHFQTNPNAQCKLVRALSGRIQDIVVDLRPNSKTFKKVFSIELSEVNGKSLFIPKGFAHGFVTLSDTAIVSYQVDNYYAPDSDAGIRFDDPNLNIDWILPREDLIISQKDLKLPTLDQYFQ